MVKILTYSSSNVSPVEAKVDAMKLEAIGVFTKRAPHACIARTSMAGFPSNSQVAE